MLARVRNILGTEPYFQANSLSRWVQALCKTRGQCWEPGQGTKTGRNLCSSGFPLQVVQLQLAEIPQAWTGAAAFPQSQLPADTTFKVGCWGLATSICEQKAQLQQANGTRRSPFLQEALMDLLPGYRGLVLCL